MQIEKMTAALRPRSGWEAIDLGFTLARVWFWRLWLLWLVPALVISMLSALLLYPYSGFITILAIWWFKPLYELPLLFYLSRVLFGEFPSFDDIRKSYFSIVKTQLLAVLTLRRFSFTRSASNPVHMLEGLSGAERKERLQVLHTSCGNSAVWLAIVCFTFEFVLWFGMITLIDLMVPDELELPGLEEILFTDGVGLSFLSLVLYVLAMSVIAPFFTASGFALYLSSRTQLEGWDIELSFKNMINRISLQKGKDLVAVLIIVFCLPLSQTAECMTKENSKQQIDEIAASPDFGEIKSENTWKRRNPLEEEEVTESLSMFEFFGDLGKWVREMAAAFAKLIEAVLWIGFISLALWVVHKYTDWLQVFGFLGSRRDEDPVVPETLFGMHLDADSLPDDVAIASRKLIEVKNYRAALSLLYRASLLKLIVNHRLKIAESATENECVELVSRTRPPEEGLYFYQLTNFWLKMAYAEEAPGNEDLFSLTEQWGQIYGDL